jgi:hypothetical protein
MLERMIATAQQQHMNATIAVATGVKFLFIGAVMRYGPKITLFVVNVAIEAV